jgi:membrane-associated phospholipid phosphatase
MIELAAGSRPKGSDSAPGPFAWVRRQFPRQVAWGRRRLAPRTPRGFWLTFTALVGALAALAFGAVTQDVVGHDGMAVHDPHVTAWMVAHRAGWLTSVLRVITWLGSTAVIIPLGVIVGVFYVLRRRRWQPLALLAAAVAGAVSLYDIVKPLTGRLRPPSAIWIGHYSGAAFPSGHAAQSVAFYAMLAIVLGAGRSPRAKTVLWSVAALVALAVGGSRIYLGAHWLTDVLGGYALGASWVATVVTVMLAASSRGTGGAELADSGHESRRPADKTPTDEPGAGASTVPHGCGLTGGHDAWVRRPGRGHRAWGLPGREQGG